jgi:hypothetical protein
MAAMRMLLHAGSYPSVGRRFARSTVVPSPETRVENEPLPTCPYGSGDLRPLAFKNDA